MNRILVTEKISPEGLEALKAGTNMEVDVRLDLDKETLPQVLGEYDALVVRSATKVTADVIAAGSNLRVIGRAGSGVDNIDVKAATERGIIVVNAPASNNVAVAELTMGLLLAMARHIPQAYNSLQHGKWDRSKYTGWEVRGKTLGLIGLGRIGSEVARRARGFEMDIIAYDPVVSSDRANQLGVESVNLEELLERSDIISIHVPMTDTTRNMFDAATLAKMKKGSCIINASRGGIINENDLVEALDTGHLAGAALDVYSKEPPPEDSKLTSHPKIIVTPHLGASTTEAQVLVGTDVAEGVLVALEGGTPRYAVNAPFIAPEAWGVLQPYIGLGRQMGAILMQLVKEPVRDYELEYCGELASVDQLPVRLAILQGLLERSSEHRVTPVNAPLIARDRGLRINEHTNAEIENYAGLLTIRANTADGSHEFSGTVLRDEPHIIQVDGFWVDFVPEGSMLFTYHRDRPGLIGRVGTLLGSADVNISAMYVGRKAPREGAMMILKVDEPIPDEVMNTILTETDIDRAYNVTLEA
jgi:D-3-phosphoglycerate dehydrogenase